MIPEKFQPVITDFVNNAGKIPNLICAILYGSIVKGEMHKKSDIDILLLFNTDHNPELGVESKVAHQISAEVMKKHPSPNPISFVFSNLNDIEPNEVDFLWNTAKEGVVIWGKPNLSMLKLKDVLEPKLLITYSMNNLERKEKVRLHRALYGYKSRTTINGKLYLTKKEGLLKKEECLGQNVLLLPAEKSDPVTSILDKFRVKYSVKKVWE